LITSRSNPFIKQAQALRRRKTRVGTGLFLVEGIHAVGEALEAGWKIESLIYAPDTLSSKFAVNLINRIKTNLVPVSGQLMESLSDKENPQGILAVVHQQTCKLPDLGKIHCGVAIVSPQDPGNVGTILRTLDAVNADVLFLLDGGVDPFHPTSVRASMGAIFWKPIVQTGFTEFVDWAANSKLQLIGTSAHAEMDYRKINHPRDCVILLGNEQKGLSPEHIKVCDFAISLPMRGRSSSLNLAVAAGILLYQFTTQ
jgi:TrmH family RNA methyltransferase